MLELVRTPMGRVVAAVVATLVLFALTIWLAPDLLPIVPAAITVPLWLALFPANRPVEPRARRILLVTLGLGVSVFLVGLFVYLGAS